MKKTIFILLLVFLVIAYQSAISQDLTTEYNVCPKTPISFQAPNDPNATQYEWDFCTGDLSLTPTASLVTNNINDNSTVNPDAQQPEGLDIVFDGNDWYGFITNVANNNLIRINFGNSLDNIPTYTNLGVITSNSLYDEPTKIRIIQDGQGNWYGFFTNNGANGFANKPGYIGGSVIKLSFGQSLLNQPSASILNTDLDFPQGIDIVNQNNSIKLLITDYPYTGAFNNTRISIFDFGTNLSSSPNVVSHNLPLFSAWGISAIQENNNWYVLSIGETSGQALRRLSFGNDFSLTPTLVNLHSFFPITNSRDIKIVLDGKNKYAMALGLNGDFYKIEFKKSITNNPTYINLGNFSLLGTKQQANRPSIAFDFVKDKSTWYGFGINRLGGVGGENQLVRVTFPNNCNASIATSTETNSSPSLLVSGKYYMNLRSYDDNLNLIQTYVDSIEVYPATVGDFSVDNQCLGEITNFNNLSLGADANVSAWEWDFGDGTTSNQKNPNHTYTQSGIYPVKLTVNNFIGNCTNTLTHSIRISNRPTADFIAKSIDCSTGEVEFEDISDIPQGDKMLGGKITDRFWLFGDGTQYRADTDSETEALRIKIIKGNDVLNHQSKAFLTPNFYPVTLTVTDDAGCASAIIKEVVLDEAQTAIPAFSNTSACEGAPIYFTDATTLPQNAVGEIDTWQWTFIGTDGTTVLGFSTEQNPVFTFLSAGTYTIKLRSGYSFGCMQEISQSLEVRPSFQSKFSTSVSAGFAPLKVQFINETPGSSAYEWNFDDGSISSLEFPEHTFTQPGTYVVSFQAKNSEGCGTLFTKNIIVSENPLAIDPIQNAQISIYPNPSSSIFKIKIEGVNFSQAQVRLYDLPGKLLQTHSFSNDYSLNLENLLKF
jgi:PKD repeat protein